MVASTGADNNLILHVEDDPTTRDMVRLILEAEGYEVRSAPNGREALNALHRNLRPRLILLDLRMPVMNGWEFRRDQKKDPELAAIPVVVFSSAGDIRQEAALIGAAGYLQKPIVPEQLVSVVRAFQAQPKGESAGRPPGP